MKQIIMITGLAYPLPKIISNGPGILGEKTVCFISNKKLITVWRDLIVAIHVDHDNYKASVNERKCERIALISGAVYQPAIILKTEQHADYGIDDIFGDEQLVFVTLEGLFITRKTAVISLTETETRAATKPQPLLIPPDLTSYQKSINHRRSDHHRHHGEARQHGNQ